MMMMRGPPVIRKTRSKVFNDRLTGRIVEWKSNFGWIQPDQAVNHPEAIMHKGKIYVSEKDLEAEIHDVGAHVSFFVYADGTGLGAQNCRPVEGSGPQPTIKKTASGHLGPAAAAATDRGGGSRRRIQDEPVKGRVKVWKGGFGWIAPVEEVNHPLFKGDIYVSGKDVENADGLGEGCEVTFYIYADAQGLGAEKVQLFSEALTPSAPMPSMPGGGLPGGTPAGGGTVLKAKPKAMAAIPAGMDPEIASRLNAWMWDRGG